MTAFYSEPFSLSYTILEGIRDIYSGPWRGEIFVKIEKQEELEGGLHEKRKGKRGKRRKKKSDKAHVKIKLKLPQKEFWRGVGNFSGWPEYIPL